MHILVVKHIVHLMAVAATPLAGGFALIFGGKAERLGAGAFIGVILLTDVFFALAPSVGFLYIDLTSTFLMSVFFLYLAVRYGNLWLAATMMVQSSELYFARIYFDSDQSDYVAYSLEINLVSLVILCLLAAAALWSWCERIQRRKEDAKREEALLRRQEVWARQYEVLLAGRLAEVAAPAPIREGRAHLTIEPQLP